MESIWFTQRSQGQGISFNVQDVIGMEDSKAIGLCNIDHSFAKTTQVVKVWHRVKKLNTGTAILFHAFSFQGHNNCTLDASMITTKSAF